MPLIKFKIDENLPIEVSDLLKQAGHEAASVQDQSLGGAKDSNVARICQQEDRAIVTLDLDFADIRAYPPRDFSGLVVLRLTRQDKLHVLGVFERLLTVIENEPLIGKLWIVEENRVRIRE
jgi:predicted nuclease of predicted toxin-antitoxin system